MIGTAKETLHDFHTGKPIEAGSPVIQWSGTLADGQHAHIVFTPETALHWLVRFVPDIHKCEAPAAYKQPVTRLSVYRNGITL